MLANLEEYRTEILEVLLGVFKTALMGLLLPKQVEQSGIGDQSRERLWTVFLNQHVRL